MPKTSAYIVTSVAIASLFSAAASSAEAGSRRGMISDFQGASSNSFQFEHRNGTIGGFRGGTAMEFATEHSRRTFREFRDYRYTNPGRRLYRHCASEAAPGTWDFTRCVDEGMN